MKRTSSGRACGRIWRQILAAWLLACAGVVWGGDSKGVSEYQVKAVFLFNFTHFVEWPAEAGAASDQPFVIGIAGEDPFGTVLDDTVRNELAQGRRPIVIQRFRGDETLPKCDILFIAQSQKDRLKELPRPGQEPGHSDGGRHRRGGGAGRDDQFGVGPGERENGNQPGRADCRGVEGQRQTPEPG